MTQNTTIQWQTGTPKHSGGYLVTTKCHNVLIDIWRNYGDRYNNHWYEHNDEDVIAVLSKQIKQEHILATLVANKQKIL